MTWRGSRPWFLAVNDLRTVKLGSWPLFSAKANSASTRRRCSRQFGAPGQEPKAVRTASPQTLSRSEIGWRELRAVNSCHLQVQKLSADPPNLHVSSTDSCLQVFHRQSSSSKCFISNYIMFRIVHILRYLCCANKTIEKQIAEQWNETQQTLETTPQQCCRSVQQSCCALRLQLRSHQFSIVLSFFLQQRLYTERLGTTQVINQYFSETLNGDTFFILDLERSEKHRLYCDTRTKNSAMLKLNPKIGLNPISCKVSITSTKSYTWGYHIFIGKWENLRLSLTWLYYLHLTSQITNVWWV